ncbi:MAG: conjugal transfer protein TrbD [Endozoicomonas sp. (ex Botrylloides leachii)]|nr:conjugal transfer protein TrbD [Endozoicomonas sp. (ex Botrylloides leachii)]
MTIRHTPIRQVGCRDTLFMGGDRELIMLSGLLSCTLLFSAVQVFSFTLRTVMVISSIAIWLIGKACFRKLAKVDPKLRHIYIRNIRYKRYYPARSTPYRINTPTQVKQYSQ